MTINPHPPEQEPIGSPEAAPDPGPIVPSPGPGEREPGTIDPDPDTGGLATRDADQMRADKEMAGGVG